MEEAAEGPEADAGLRLRGVCQRRHRLLLPDSGHPAQRGGRVHPRRTARHGLTDARHRLLVLCVTARGSVGARTKFKKNFKKRGSGPSGFGSESDSWWDRAVEGRKDGWMERRKERRMDGKKEGRSK